LAAKEESEWGGLSDNRLWLLPLPPPPESLSLEEDLPRTLEDTHFLGPPLMMMMMMMEGVRCK